MFVAALLLFSVGACSDKEEPAQITISDGSKDFFQDRMDFTSAGGSQTVQFTTNKDWEIKVSESGMNVDWCTVTPSVGKPGDVTVTITVPDNITYSERSVVLTLTAGDVSEKLRVSQKQNDAILLSSTLYELPMEGGSIDLAVQSNVNYQVEIPEQYQAWIKRESRTRALSSSDLKFKVAENLDYDKREGEIVISDGNITEVVKVYQAGAGVLVLSNNEYAVPSEGGVVTVDLSSNFEYEFELPQVDWIKVSPATRGMSSHTMNFDIEPNELYDGRSASIRFYDPNGTVSETVTVNQAQKDAIVISQKEYAVDSNQNFISIEVNSNVEFQATVDPACTEWIRLAENPLTRALNPYKLDYVIEENRTYDPRQGTITITSADGSIADVVAVTQSQNDAIIIDTPKDVTISYEGGVVNLDINANVDVELEFLQDWTHLPASTRGLVKTSRSFIVDENDTPCQRTATVIVKKPNATAPTDTMHVTQEKGFLTLNVTPGNLATQLAAYPDLTVTRLKLTGSLNKLDYLTLIDIKTLWNLDLSGLEDTTMPNQAFMGVWNIKTIRLPEKLMEIPDGLFDMTGASTQGLTCELQIPKSVKKIGRYAFTNNDLSGKLVIPDNVVEIGEGAFMGVSNISELYIGKGVKSLPQSCFNGFGNWYGTFTKLHLGENIEVIGSNSLSSCRYTGTLVIPDKVSLVEYCAFIHSEFEIIVFGKNITSIGEGSLNNLGNLKSIYCKSEIPPYFPETVESTRLRRLYVPIGCKSTYERTEGWKDFLVIEEFDYDNCVIPGTEQYQ